MSTLTNTEGTLQQQTMAAWKTSGAAAPWQIFTSSNATFVAAPDISTMPLVFGCPIIIEIERLDVQEPKLDKQPAKEQLPLFSGGQDALQPALLNLLAYSPEPDEPSDQDVGPEFGYRFPR